MALGVLCAACGGSAMNGNSAHDGGLLATWDGGLLPPTPGLVRCGEIVCAEGYECCVRESRGDPPSNGCDSPPSGAFCNGSQGTRRCDETADCGSGELCFWETEGIPQTLTSFCQGAVFLGAWDYSRIGCGSEADCDAVGAPACVAQQCRGDIIQTCGYIPSDMCPPARE